MITLITGVVGSGKTVYCIEELTKLKNGTSTYKGHDNIYTNIANFKLSYFDDTPYKYFDLNFSNIYTILKELYHIYIEYEDKEEDTDTALIEYAKKHNFYNCFMVFDECHHFFDNQDKVKIWYITYHRHIAHNIFLITQNKMLINTKYRQSPELYVKALPMTKKLGVDFKYNTYGEFSMKDKIESITIKNRPELFEMYTSGNFTKQKSYAMKPLIIFFVSIALIIGLVIFLFVFMSSNIPETEPKKEPEKVTNNSFVEPKKEPIKSVISPSLENKFVIKVIFISSLGYYINNEWYNHQHFRKFLYSTKSEILSTKKLYKDDTRTAELFFVRTDKKSLDLFFVPLPVEYISTQNNNKNDDLPLPNINISPF